MSSPPSDVESHSLLEFSEIEFITLPSSVSDQSNGRQEPQSSPVSVSSLSEPSPPQLSIGDIGHPEETLESSPDATVPASIGSMETEPNKSEMDNTAAKESNVEDEPIKRCKKPTVSSDLSTTPLSSDNESAGYCSSDEPRLLQLPRMEWKILQESTTTGNGHAEGIASASTSKQDIKTAKPEPITKKRAACEDVSSNDSSRFASDEGSSDISPKFHLAASKRQKKRRKDDLTTEVSSSSESPHSLYLPYRSGISRENTMGSSLHMEEDVLPDIPEEMEEVHMIHGENLKEESTNTSVTSMQWDAVNVLATWENQKPQNKSLVEKQSLDVGEHPQSLCDFEEKLTDTVDQEKMAETSDSKSSGSESTTENVEDTHCEIMYSTSDAVDVENKDEPSGSGTKSIPEVMENMECSLTTTHQGVKRKLPSPEESYPSEDAAKLPRIEDSTNVETKDISEVGDCGSSSKKQKRSEYILPTSSPTTSSSISDACLQRDVIEETIISKSDDSVENIPILAESSSDESVNMELFKCSPAILDEDALLNAPEKPKKLTESRSNNTCDQNLSIDGLSIVIKKGEVNIDQSDSDKPGESSPETSEQNTDNCLMGGSSKCEVPMEGKTFPTEKSEIQGQDIKQEADYVSEVGTYQESMDVTSEASAESFESSASTVQLRDTPVIIDEDALISAPDDEMKESLQYFPDKHAVKCGNSDSVETRLSSENVEQNRSMLESTELNFGTTSSDGLERKPHEQEFATIETSDKVTEDSKTTDPKLSEELIKENLKLQENSEKVDVHESSCDISASEIDAEHITSTVQSEASEVVSDLVSQTEQRCETDLLEKLTFQGQANN